MTVSGEMTLFVTVEKWILTLFDCCWYVIDKKSSVMQNSYLWIKSKVTVSSRFGSINFFLFFFGFGILDWCKSGSPSQPTKPLFSLFFQECGQNRGHFHQKLKKNSQCSNFSMSKQNEYKESGVNTVNGCVPTVNCKGVLKIKVYFARIRRPHRKNSVQG